MHCKTKNLFLLLLLLSVQQIFAQVGQQHWTSDRVGNSPYPSRMQKGMIALEGGYEFLRSEVDNNTNTNTQVPFQLRYGLMQNMEITLATGYRRFDQVDTLISGADFTSVGAKFRIAEEEGWHPLIEVHGNLRLPYFGETAFIPEDVEPSFDINFLNNLSERLQLTYGFGMFWRGPDENGFYGIKLTKFVNEQNAFFGEHYSYLRGNGNNEAHFSLGYILLATTQLQFDLSLDVGFAKEKNCWGVNIGLSSLLRNTNP